MTLWPILPAVSLAALLCVQVVSVVLCLRRLRRPTVLADTAALPAISILRPVCGLENHLDATLRSTFRLDTGRDDTVRDDTVRDDTVRSDTVRSDTGPFEILFCVARADDAAAPLVRRLIDEHPDVPARLLIGDERVSGNPKLNNLVKGWAAARHDWIVMADSNVALPRDYLRQLVGCWTPGTGLVTSPAIGAGPVGVWASLECAFLNTYQARWQMVADEIGQGFAQGKTLFWRRDILESGGGLAALGAELAEDVAATKLVRRRGLKVRVAQAAFPQPLGRRRLAEVWRRQVRWARVRRQGFPMLYAPEVVTGGLAPALIVAAMAASGAVPWMALPAVVVFWYGAEFLLAQQAGWPRTPVDVACWMLRDLLLPAVWVAGWAGSGFTWRGNAMAPEPAAPRRTAGAGSER